MNVLKMHNFNNRKTIYLFDKGGNPTEKDYFEATKSTYQNIAYRNIDDYINIFDGETMDIFLNNNKKEILIGIRGTKSFDDVITDLNFITNTLSYTHRYKNDKNKLDEIIKIYNPIKYNYFITGYSLGGGISAQFMRDYPFIKESIVYNSATQPIDIISQNPKITYFYIDKDPLYLISGHFIKNKKVYPYNSGLNGKYSYLIPSILQAHKLNQFDRLYKN